MSGRFYNGYSPAERRAALVVVKAALANGALQPAHQCSVCGSYSATPLSRHGERYDRPLEAYIVCRRCHWALHARFRRPKYWKAYIAALDQDGWFRRLSVDPATIMRPFAETYPMGLDDLAAASVTD